MVLLGLNVASGVLYYAAVTAPGQGSGEDVLVDEVRDAPARLLMSASLQGAAQLADFKQRFAQDLSALHPARVGLLTTRAHSGWVYRQAVARIAPVSAVMLACEEAGVPFVELRTEAVGKAVSLPTKDIDALPHAVAGFTTRPTYWTAGRAGAFAAAAALVAGVGAAGD